MRLLTVLGKAVVTVAAGVTVGAVGTVMHRASPPWGLVGTLALVLAAAVTARAWAGWGTWFGYVAGLAVTVLAMSQSGPGGDVLVPAGQVTSWVWLVSALALALAVGSLPAGWFTDRHRRRGRHAAGSARVAARRGSEPPATGSSATVPPLAFPAPGGAPVPAAPAGDPPRPGERPEEPRPFPSWPPRPDEPRR